VSRKQKIRGKPQIPQISQIDETKGRDCPRFFLSSNL
jgi:hypothetical protein